MSAIYGALAAVMNDVDHVAKRDKNEQQRFLFRGIDAVVNAVGPILRKHSVIVVPNVEAVTYEQLATSNGKQVTSCRVVAEYVFYATDGSSVSAKVAGEAFDFGDKATPKAMSVAFRTALLQALALPTDEPDPDSQSYERSAPHAAVQRSAAVAEMLLLMDDIGLPDAASKLAFAADVLGFQVAHPDSLSDADAEKVVAALKAELDIRAAQKGADA